MTVLFGNYVPCQNNFKLRQINTTGAKYTINAIVKWLQLNRNCIDLITLVDAQNCYAELF